MTAMHPSTVNKSSQTTSSAAPEAAKRFLNYVDASPTPFHATSTSAAMLQDAGFIRLKENDDWEDKIQAGGKYLWVSQVIG